MRKRSTGRWKTSHQIINIQSIREQMENNLDSLYWDNRYKQKETGWDIGYVSTPIREYAEQLKDTGISILIPGCGNAYEAEYLLDHGFTQVSLVDISPVIVNNLAEKLHKYNRKQLDLICADFFSLEGKYDLIIEQTFFCALDPSLREAYVTKMHGLLKPGGKLAGVLFNRSFEGGPPFGGNIDEYQRLFSSKFTIKTMDTCYNSIEPRKGSEVFVILVK